jgi:hypothetical protein
MADADDEIFLTLPPLVIGIIRALIYQHRELAPGRNYFLPPPASFPIQCCYSCGICITFVNIRIPYFRIHVVTGRQWTCSPECYRTLYLVVRGERPMSDESWDRLMRAALR